MKVIRFPDETLSLQMSPGLVSCYVRLLPLVFCVCLPVCVCVQLTFVKHHDSPTHRFQAHDHYKRKQKNIQKKTNKQWSLKCVVWLPAPSGLVRAAAECPIDVSHICGWMIREYPKRQQSIQPLIVFDLEARQCGAVMMNKASVSLRTKKRRENNLLFRICHLVRADKSQTSSICQTAAFHYRLTESHP